MLNLETLEKYDSHKMFEIYNKWPQIAKESYYSDLKEFSEVKADHIVFAGMGGSGAIGSIFSSILSKTNVHVSVVKGYLLPNTVNAKTLVISTSISGNTAETLTVLDSAKNLGCKIIALSSGGKMEEYCLKNNIDYQKIPKLHSPRASFTGFLYSMLKILKPILPIPTSDIDESVTALEKLGREISSSNLSTSNQALNLAEWISGIPLIYSPAGLQAAAIRFKNSLQENSKIHAMMEDVIETCHNGIVSWENPSNVIPILLKGEDDFIKTKERYDILEEFFQTKNIDYKIIHSGKGNILTKLMRLIYLLDFSTIYKSVLSEIDPTPIDSIDFVKSKNL